MPGSGLVPVTVRSHPLRAERERVEVPEGRTIAELVDALVPDPIVRSYLVARLDGRPIPTAWWPRVRPRAGHLLEVGVVPAGGGGGKNIFRLLLTVAVIAASALAPALLPATGAFAAGSPILGTALTVGRALSGVVAFGGLLAVNALVPNRPPRLGDLSGTGGSPTLFIEGARNEARPFQPIPVVLARYRATPPYGTQPTTESLGSDQYLNLLFVWGIGPLSIDEDSLKIGETPLSSFEDVEVEHREGFPDDEPITIFGAGGEAGSGSETVYQENLSVEIAPGGGTATRTTQPDADAISVDLTLPRGCAVVNPLGELGVYQIWFDIDYRKVGATSWNRLEPLGQVVDPDTGIFVVSIVAGDTPLTYTVSPEFLAFFSPLAVGQPATFLYSGANTNAVRLGVRFNPHDGPGQYEVRITYQLGHQAIADYDGYTILNEVVWSALRTVRNGDPIQTGVGGGPTIPLAKTALRIKATGQLNGVVDELNGIVTSYAPIWDGVAWTDASIDDWQPTNNPAALYRLVLQGNGSAFPFADDRLDLDTLATWYEFCEARGLTFNMVRDFTASVWDTLADVAAAGRASPTVIDGKWSVVIDQAQATAVSHVTPRTSSDFAIERAFLEPPHGWRIRFPNEDEDYRQDERRVYAAGYTEATATRFESLELPGVTNPTQVQRLGRFKIAQGAVQTERWSYRTDLEFLTYRRGDRVSVTHDVLVAGLASGRVKTVTVDSSNDVVSVGLDEPAVMSAGTDYGLVLRTVTGGQVTAQVETVAGTQAEVTFSTPIANVGGEPAIVAGDLYGFGVLGSETDEALVLSIEPETDLRARVTLVPYVAELYETETETVPTFDTSVTPLAEIPAPVVRSVGSGLEFVALSGTGQFTPRINVEFNPAPADPDLTPNRLEVQARHSSTSEAFSDRLPVTLETPTSVLLAGVVEGETWDLRLRFVVEGRLLPGPWAYVYNHTVEGLSEPPADLVDLDLSTVGGSARLTWTPPTEFDVIYGGEVRFRFYPDTTGATWAASIPIGTGDPNAGQLDLPLLTGTYLARVYDAGGNRSGVSEVTAEVTSLIPFTTSVTIAEDPTFAGVRTDVETTSIFGTVYLRIVETSFDEVSDVDALADWDAGTGVISDGLYEFDNSADLGAAATVRVSRVLAAESVASDFATIDERLANVDDWEDIDLTDQGAGTARVEMRSTPDDPAATDPAWSAWSALVSREVYARGFEFRAVLETTDPILNVHVSELGATIETPTL